MPKSTQGIKMLCQQCGGNDQFIDHYDGSCVVVCRECGDHGYFEPTEAEALAAWNSHNRAAERKLIERIGELEKIQAAASTARAILFNIDSNLSDRIAAVGAIGKAFQALDLALNADNAEG